MRRIQLLTFLTLVLMVGCMPAKKDTGSDIASPPPSGHLPSERGGKIQRAAPDVAVEIPAAPDIAEPREIAPSGGGMPEGQRGGAAAPTCTPDCLLKTCGPDGCGGACGACGEHEECEGGRCVAAGCVPGCEGKACGPDGCGGTCDRCRPPARCTSGACRSRVGVGLFDTRPGTPGDGILRAVENLYLGFPAAWTGHCDYAEFPRVKADGILARNPAGAVLLSLLPECGFASFVTDFVAGTRPWEAVRKLGEDIAAFEAPVIVRIAPQMNAPWFPWGPCVLDNKGKPCLDAALTYREGFANVAGLLKEHGGPDLRIAWTPLAEPAYWREAVPEYPTYEDFYPGDEAVDYVGVDISWGGEDPPPEGAFAAGVEPFYRAWAAPEGRGKPMIISETTLECRLTEETACVASVPGFESTDGWQGPWSRLKVDDVEGAAPEDCPEIRNGDHHQVLTVTTGEDGSARCGGYYLGGLLVPVAWGEGVDLSAGNALRLRARKELSGAAPTVQLEICDTTAPGCPGEDRCCPAESVTVTLTVDSVEWSTWTLPFESFSPSQPGTAPDMDWSRVRAVKIHLVCPDLRGPLAPLHLDGVGVVRITSDGEAECDARRRAWARQVYTPDLCTRYPNLDLVLWRQALRRTADGVYDGRIRDPEFWRELWRGECFSGTWW